MEYNHIQCIALANNLFILAPKHSLEQPNNRDSKTHGNILRRKSMFVKDVSIFYFYFNKYIFLPISL